jgi:hypothetical protein
MFSVRGIEPLVYWVVGRHYKSYFALSKWTPFGRPFPNSLSAIGCRRRGVAMKSVGINYLTVVTHTEKLSTCTKKKQRHPILGR